MIKPTAAQHEVPRPALLDFVTRQFRPLVSEVVGQPIELSNPPTRGNLNFSFLVAPDGESAPRWVLRVKDGSELEHTFLGPMEHTYAKERTLQKLLSQRGVLAAQPVGPVMGLNERLGRHGPFVGSIQTLLDGTDGSRLAAHGTPAELPLLREIGRLARPLSTIMSDCFGDTIERDDGWFQLNWQSYIDKLSSYTLEADSLTLFPVDARAAFVNRLERLRVANPTPVLIHADLRLSNALFDESQKAIALIDWERACSSIVEEEFARILYENFVLGQRIKDLATIDSVLAGTGVTPHFEAFLDGFGVSIESYHKSYRARTEDILLILCVDFFAHFEREWKMNRPDWGLPGRYARQAAETILNKG
jgi:hypothetical protein